MRAVVVLVMVGCGRVGFEPLDDGGAVATNTPDGGARTYRDVVMADQPIGYWRLGDGGGTAADETATTTGTFVGNCQHSQPGLLTGDANTAVQFDGASCFVRLGDVYSFPARSPYSIEAWYRAADPTTYQGLFVKQTRLGANPDDGYMMLNGPGGVYAERVKQMVNARTDDAPVPATEVHHYVATYDGTTLLLYVDGTVAVATVTDTDSMPTYSTDATIGASSDGFQMFADGVIDEVALYDHAVGADRVALHHDIGRNGPH